MFKVGMYKDHPPIPPEMSESAKLFQKRCFVPEPEKRATAGELLEDSFITDMGKKKNKTRLSIQQDFMNNRSVSAPAPTLSRVMSRYILETFSIMEIESETFSVIECQQVRKFLNLSLIPG